MVGKKTTRIGISELREKLHDTLVNKGVAVTKLLAADMCNALFKVIKDELKKGSQVAIKEFGVFSLGMTGEKHIRDFRTKKMIKVPSHQRIYFKMSKSVEL